MATVPVLDPEKKPKLSYRATREFELREVDFGADTTSSIKQWLHQQIETRRKQLKRRHENLVPEWRRVAEGKPREKNKSWPFENCSNLVHQIVGEACDDMSARVMMLLYATSPLVIYRYLTKAQNPTEAAHNTDKAKTLESFMDFVGYEPTELDLWNKENIWFSDSAKLGTSWVCAVPEKITESVYIGYESGKKRTSFEEDTLYEGPKVLNLRDEDLLYDPDADTPEDSDFIARKATLTRWKLQEREFKKLYRAGTVAEILGHPDRYGPDENRKKEGRNKGVVDTEERILAEWDIWECYFPWYHKNKKFRLIAWFHYETKTLMNLVYNFIPDNQLPLVRTRLASDSKGMNGRGYADMLNDNQDEVSTAKNQRNDAITWGILGINRISPVNKNIDKNFKVFPGAGMPFGKDEFEHFEVGSPAFGGLSLENERAMIEQARERAGVGPAVAGAGTGQVDKKGRYGSMGTLAVMQDSNTRASHRTSDFRHSHVKLFGLLTDMYGAMGLGRRGSLFGLDDRILSEALSDYLERKVRIPIRAATASMNREVTKQNELLLNQQIGLYVKETSTMIQAIMNAQAPPYYKKWLTEIVKSRTRLFQQIIRDFQLSDQPEEFLPNVEFEEDKNAKEQANPNVLPMAAELQQPGQRPVTPIPSRMASNNL